MSITKTQFYFTLTSQNIEQTSASKKGRWAIGVVGGSLGALALLVGLKIIKLQMSNVRGAVAFAMPAGILIGSVIFLKRAQMLLKENRDTTQRGMQSVADLVDESAPKITPLKQKKAPIPAQKSVSVTPKNDLVTFDTPIEPLTNELIAQLQQKGIYLEFNGNFEKTASFPMSWLPLLPPGKYFLCDAEESIKEALYEKFVAMQPREGNLPIVLLLLCGDNSEFRDDSYYKHQTQYENLSSQPHAVFKINSDMTEKGKELVENYTGIVKNYNDVLRDIKTSVASTIVELKKLPVGAKLPKKIPNVKTTKMEQFDPVFLAQLDAKGIHVEFAKLSVKNIKVSHQFIEALPKKNWYLIINRSGLNMFQGFSKETYEDFYRRAKAAGKEAVVISTYWTNDVEFQRLDNIFTKSHSNEEEWFSPDGYCEITSDSNEPQQFDPWHDQCLEILQQNNMMQVWLDIAFMMNYKYGSICSNGIPEQDQAINQRFAEAKAGIASLGMRTFSFE